jgi:Tol biopolymer transport system component/DNA-binding winged helix-turn-helix (wHTH) protein
MSSPRVVYGFGPFRLDTARRTLLRNGELVALSSRAFDILLTLVESRGGLVEKDALMALVWPDAIVEEGNLTFHVHLLRKALGDDRQNGNRLIETAPRRGYRFLGAVEVLEPEPPAVVGAPAAAQIPAPGVRRFRPSGWPAAIAFAAVACAGVFLYLSLRPPPAPRMLGYRQLTHDASPNTIATDGLRVYFSKQDGRRLWSVSVQGGEAAPVDTPFADLAISDISPDKSRLLVSARMPGEERVLWILPLPAGRPIRVTANGHEGCWSPDGKSVAYADGRDLNVVSADGTGRRRLTTTASDAVEFPRWRPDGKLLSFEAVSANSGRGSLWEIAPDGTGKRKLELPDLRGDQMFGGVIWRPDGRYLLFAVETGGRADIWALRGKLPWWSMARNRPVNLTDMPLSLRLPAISPDGQTLFAVGDQNLGKLARYDARLGEFVEYLGGLRGRWVNFSRDGRWVAYITYPERTVWRMRPDGTERAQLTFAPMEADGLDWSPDGKTIAVRAKRPGLPYKIHLVRADGAGAQELLPDHHQEEGIGTWSPDGRRITFGDVPAGFGRPAGNEVIHVYDLAASRISSLPGSEGRWTSRWSPDGRYISATSIKWADQPAPSRLALFDVARKTWRELAADFVESPIWSRDGRYIYFIRKGSTGWLCRLQVPDGRIEQLVNLSGLDLTGLSAGWIGLSPDDSPILLRNTSTTDVYALDVEWP